jgi:hypothetical protein
LVTYSRGPEGSEAGFTAGDADAAGVRSPRWFGADPEHARVADHAARMARTRAEVMLVDLAYLLDK